MFVQKEILWTFDYFVLTCGTQCLWSNCPYVFLPSLNNSAPIPTLYTIGQVSLTVNI